MNLNQILVAKLRKMASSGTTVRTMIDEIHRHLKTDDGLALVVDRYLMEAFHLNLSQVRVVEGCSRLGSKAYSDEEIDRLVLPRIEATRHLWLNK
jgi:hypothetical protein